MKHHAKASSAGFSSGRGSRLGSLGRGAFATCGVSGGADGSDAPSHRRGAVVSVASVLAVLALFAFASGASAAGPSRDHLSAFGSFSGTSPQALAVDQQTGDVYAASPSDNNVYRFDSEGNPANFTCGGCSGNTLSGFSMAAGPGRVEIAVDNSGGPTDGDVYVAASVSAKVYIYSRSGELLGTLEGSETPEGEFFNTCGVAVDQSNGDLYVGDYGSGIFRYTPSGTAPTDSDYAGGIIPVGFGQFGACQVAADHGHVYAADLEHHKPVMRFSASQFVPGEHQVAGTAISSTNTAKALSLDPANGDLYVDEGNHIDVYGPYGAKLYSFGSAAEFGSSAGIAVQADGQAYVADPEAHQVDVYGGVPVGSPPPGAVTNAASAVSIDAATLNGSVNPHSTEIADCHFEYVDDAGFQANGFTGAATATCVPNPGESANPVAVHADVTGLQTGTTYHVRLVVSSAGGMTIAEPKVFTTVPIAFTDTATGTLHHTDATLNGHFDPHGDAITSCQFDWGTTTAYGNTTPCAEDSSFSAPAQVSAFVNELVTGEKIHYRLHLMTAAHGDAVGADRTFTPQQSTHYELTATSGSAGSGADQLSPGARGVAVDQSNGDVYVADTGNRRIDKFDSEGNFISAWGWGVVASGPDKQTGANDRQSITLENATGGSFALSLEAAVGHGTITGGSPTVTNLVTEGGEFDIGEQIQYGQQSYTIIGVDSEELTLSEDLPGNGVQSVTLAATATTGNIPFDATAAEVRAGLEGLPTIGPGDVQVSGSSGGPWTVEFVGARGQVNVPQLTADMSNLEGAGRFVQVQTVQQGGAFEVCSVANGDACRAGDFYYEVGAEPAAAGQLGAPEYLSVNNSGGASQGDVYVSDSKTRTVTKFTPSGGLVVSWGSDAQVTSVSKPAGITVDSTGNVQVIDKNSAGPDNLRVFDGASGALVKVVSRFGEGTSDLAIEAGGTYLELGGLAVRRFDPSLPTTATGNYFYVSRLSSTLMASVNDLAIDPSTGDLYTVAGEGPHGLGYLPSQFRRYRFDAEGNVVQPDGSVCTPQTDIAFGGEKQGTEGCDETAAFGVGDLTDAHGIAIYAASRKFYTTDSGQLKIFTAFATTPPTVTIEAPSPLTGTTATFNAKVDPEDHEVTGCHFSYVADAEFKASGYSNASEAPCSPGPGSGSGDVAVSGEASGLEPATVYHFRIAAENATAHSTVASADRTFITRGPIVANTHANPVRATEATLDAAVNPQGDPTTYHFQYGPTSSYGSSTEEGAPIGGGSARSVSQQIDGLAPGTTYHFRIVAKNSYATIEGPDVSFTTAGAVDSCTNAALRTGFGFNLPDCRAYEQASQIDKGGSSAGTSNNITMVAEDGNGVTYGTTAGFPTPSGTGEVAPVVARRDASGWHTNGLAPASDEASIKIISGLDPNLLTSQSTVEGAFEIGDTGEGTWTCPFSGPPGLSPTIPSYAVDPSHFLIGSSSALTSDALEGKENLYEYDHGSLSLADRVPAFPATSCDDQGGSACVAAPGGAANGAEISGDGSRVVFAEAGSGRIYLREGGRTIQVNVSQAAGTDPNGHKPAVLWTVSAEASTVFFTSCEKLTDDSTAVSTVGDSCTEMAGSPQHRVQGSDLYSYDAGTGQLTDLTVDDYADPLGADVRQVLASSPDGSYVYFAAQGRLAPDASAGACSASCELYMVHDGGAPIAVAGLSLSNETFGANSSIASDGTLAFTSHNQLTSYENEGKAEIYRYHPGDPAVTCVSCDPSGVTPVGSASTDGGLPAVNIIGAIQTPHPRRVISSDGRRVFFETPDALVPADTNGDAGCPLTPGGLACTDVYEWEADGAGSCDSAAENGGCLYLISSGTSDHHSYLAGASASGSDVFIDTQDRLVAQDEDGLYDVYDARVGGGIASQQQTSPPPCGGAEQCHGPLTSSPAAPGAGTAAFQGPGNSKPAAKKKPHKKHRHRRKRHRKHAKHSHRRANSDRGGSK